jgi:hypothetical protein
LIYFTNVERDLPAQPRGPGAVPASSRAGREPEAAGGFGPARRSALDHDDFGRARLKSES